MATILGLLLVVTFIANYIATTLPSQMSANDTNHEVQVENQLGQFVALLQAYSSANAVGAQVTLPVSLGSVGAPPFAGPDGGTIGPANATTATVNASLVGPLVPPPEGVPNTGSYSLVCSRSPAAPSNATSITCTALASAVWNFSAGNSKSYLISGSGGLTARTNFTTSNSNIVLTTTGGATETVAVFGSHDNVYVNATGGVTVTLVMIGSNNTILTSITGGGAIRLLVVGDHDSVSATTSGASTILARFYGGYDSLANPAATAVATVYFTGFNLENPVQALCPYDNVANTNTVSGAGGGNVYYNNTNYSHATGGSPWVAHYNNPTPSACPYLLGIPYHQALPVTGFLVSLHNTYAPAAEIALDSGALVFAQPGGTPLILDPPSIGLGATSATIWLPAFAGVFPSESGNGDADLLVRLLSNQNLTWPSGGFSISEGSPVNVTITTPYAAGWMAYFASTPSLIGHVSCSGLRNVCSAPYETGSPVGRIVISLPVATVTVDVATFSVQLT